MSTIYQLQQEQQFCLVVSIYCLLPFIDISNMMNHGCGACLHLFGIFLMMYFEDLSPIIMCICLYFLVCILICWKKICQVI